MRGIIYKLYEPEYTRIIYKNTWYSLVKFENIWIRAYVMISNPDPLQFSPAMEHCTRQGTHAWMERIKMEVRYGWPKIGFSF